MARREPARSSNCDSGAVDAVNHTGGVEEGGRFVDQLLDVERDLYSFVDVIGVGIILVSAAMLVWGPYSLPYPHPPTSKPLAIAGLSIEYNSILVWVGHSKEFRAGGCLNELPQHQPAGDDHQDH